MSLAAGKLGATRASATTFLIPAVAVALGVAVRHERVTLLSVVGSVVCAGGAWFMRRARSFEEVGITKHPRTCRRVAQRLGLVAS